MRQLQSTPENLTLTHQFQVSIREFDWVRWENWPKKKYGAVHCINQKQIEMQKEFCLSITPDEISVYYYRGISNLRGNKLEALFDFNKYVLLLEQQRVDLRNDRGMFVNACAIQIMQKNEEKALTLLTTTIIINPNFGLAYLYRGLIFQQNNEMKEANDDFKEVMIQFLFISIILLSYRSYAINSQFLLDGTPFSAIFIYA